MIVISAEGFCAFFYRCYNQFDLFRGYALKFRRMISGIRLFPAISKFFCELFCVEIKCFLALGPFAWRTQEDVHYCC